MILGLGGPSDGKHQQAVRDIIDWERWTRGALSDSFQEMMSDWRLYLSKRTDHRKAWEKKWRAFTLQPYPYVIIEGKTAAMVDIINGSDPLIQAEGVGDEDLEIAHKIERLLDMTLRSNQWRLKTEQIVREAAIQGTMAIKVTWKHTTSRVSEQNSQAWAEFDSLKQAFQQNMGVEVPDNPGEYAEFAKATQEQFGVAIPPTHPSRLYRDVTTFRGPSFDRVPLTDLRFDPLTENWGSQRRIMQRIIKPKKWVMDQAGADQSLPFDEESVKAAIDGMPQEKFDEFQREVADMLKLGSAATGYPVTNDLCELYETFDPEDEESPYKVMLNRLTIINKDPGGMPYGHGENPIHLIRNVPTPGSALGLGELKAPRKLFYELWALRDLRLDAVTLSTLPIFGKLNDLGIADISKILQPGMSIPLPRLDALKRLDLGSVHPDIWKEIPEIKSEIDDATSVYSSSRGQPATVGRVSAAESERRFSGAMLRMKGAATRFEEEIAPAIRQSLYLWYQNGDDQTLITAGGPGTEQYGKSVSREELGQALEMDFNFRGPSRMVNKDMLIQQIMQWFSSFGPLIKPSRQLAVARETYEIMGLKNRNQVLPDEDIAKALQAEQAAEMMAQGLDPATGLPLPPQAPAAPGQAPQEAPAQPAAPPEQPSQPAPPAQ